MPTIRRLTLLTIAWLIGLSVTLPSLHAQTPLPRELSDHDFWKMISDFSEPAGYYKYENFMSNEDDYQAVLPALEKSRKSGSIYIGVGPEQNFTYISAVRPAMAFIIDIRRQNLLEHLLYKALFELSADRSAFISRLFSRRPPTKLKSNLPIDELFRVYERAQPDQRLYQTNLRAVYDHLTQHHGFPLSAEDKDGIAKVYSTFFQGGPQMDYRFNSYSFPTAPVSYTGLMQATDHG